MTDAVRIQSHHACPLVMRSYAAQRSTPIAHLQLMRDLSREGAVAWRTNIISTITKSLPDAEKARQLTMTLDDAELTRLQQVALQSPSLLKVIYESDDTFTCFRSCLGNTGKCSWVHLLHLLIR